jgi:hypothetical protein
MFLGKNIQINNGANTANRNDNVAYCGWIYLNRCLVKYSLCLLLSIVLIGCSLGGMRHNNGEAVISLTRPDGTYVVLPLNGPLHSYNAERIAREIQSLDKIIAIRKASTASESDIAMLSVACESRNDALRELDLALRIAQQTSAGQLDDGILRKAEQYSSGASKALRSPVPTIIMVATQISTSVANATLHYMGKGDYDNKLNSWASYSKGDRLRIGRYVFRVEPSESNSEIYDELVLVITDPTERVITPLHGPIR